MQYSFSQCFSHISCLLQATHIPPLIPLLSIPLKILILSMAVDFLKRAHYKNDNHAYQIYTAPQQQDVRHVGSVLKNPLWENQGELDP